MSEYEFLEDLLKRSQHGQIGIVLSHGEQLRFKRILGSYWTFSVNPKGMYMRTSVPKWVRMGKNALADAVRRKLTK